MTDDKTPITVAEAGRRGGMSTSERYGKPFYEEIGTKGGDTTATRYGTEFYREIGRKGGKAKAAKNAKIEDQP